MDYTRKRLKGAHRCYTLGRPLKDGRGGEGTVYRIKGRPGLVAKIYHKQTRIQAGAHMRRQKLECMIKHSVPTKYRGKLRVAWPQDILYSGSQLVGYVMPRVRSAHGLYEVWTQGKQDTVFRKYTWRKSVCVAGNLARVIAALHKNGVVVGDFNPKNFLVDRAGNVILVDADSFDITDPKTRERFPCQVARPEMLAPELQGCRNLSTVKAPFSRQTDNFSLALLIFRLLMSGFHPFNCICVEDAVSSSAGIDEQTEIVNGNCAYVRKVPGREISPLSPALEFLPADVQTLFCRTFNYTAYSARANIPNRASPEEWVRSLDRLRRKPMRRCRSNRRHLFPGHNKTCPFCGQKPRNRIGRLLVPVILAAVLLYGQDTAALKLPSLPELDAAGVFISDTAAMAGEWIRQTSDAIKSWFISQEASQDIPETTPEKSDQILPSDQRLLRTADIKGMTRDEVQLAINEIYARHGRYFADPRIRAYFLSTSWYTPQKSLSDSQIVEMLSETEWENLQFLIKYRDKLS